MEILFKASVDVLTQVIHKVKKMPILRDKIQIYTQGAIPYGSSYLYPELEVQDLIRGLQPLIQQLWSLSALNQK